MSKDFWKGRRVFITGANGFLGSWLTKALVERGARVIVLIKEEIPGSILNPREDIYSKLEKVIWGDLTEYALVDDIFKTHNIDTCFHLAAQAIVGLANSSPTIAFESNIKGTWNLLEAARNNRVPRIIVASSDKAYGEHTTLPYSEDYSLAALHPYDASKACADILARTYAHTYNLPISVTRCANIYGGGDMNFSRIVPDTIQAIIRGKSPIIRSDGSPLRDYIYIEDVVRAYLILAEHIGEKAVNGQAFNFGTRRPISVLELVNEIIRLSGRKSLRPVILGKGKLKGEIDRQYLDVTKARRLLNWEPRHSLEEGLKKTIKWYENFFKTEAK